MLNGLFKRKPRQTEWMRGFVFAERLCKSGEKTTGEIVSIVSTEMEKQSLDMRIGFIDYINNLEKQNAKK